MASTRDCHSVLRLVQRRVRVNSAFRFEITVDVDVVDSSSFSFVVFVVLLSVDVVVSFFVDAPRLDDECF